MSSMWQRLPRVVGNSTSTGLAGVRFTRNAPYAGPKGAEIMFANTKAYSGFAVDDLEKAQKFYGGTVLQER